MTLETIATMLEATRSSYPVPMIKMIKPPPQSDPFANPDLQRLLIFIYLIPVLGFFPALWTLYRRRGSYEQRQASRLVVTLSMVWLLGYLLLGLGSQTSSSPNLALLIMSSLLTSGYFLANIWLMVYHWQGKPLRLPGVSHLSDRLP